MWPHNGSVFAECWAGDTSTMSTSPILDWYWLKAGWMFWASLHVFKHLHTHRSSVNHYLFCWIVTKIVDSMNQKGKELHCAWFSWYFKQEPKIVTGFITYAAEQNSASAVLLMHQLLSGCTFITYVWWLCAFICVIRSGFLVSESNWDNLFLHKR